MPEIHFKASEIKDDITRRNYHLIWHYLIFLLDSGLDYLKRLYIKNNSDTPFKEFSANSYFTFILKDYIRDKIKNQIRVILHTAAKCVEHYDGEQIDPLYLDKVIEKGLPLYYKYDLALLNTSSSHPGQLELKQISKLTYRVSVIQATRLLACREEDIADYPALVRCTFKTFENCWNSVNAILSMVDQMIDCFERNLDMIMIPFYKPTFTMRDFQYVRKIYEYALDVLDDQISTIFREEEK